MKRKPKIKVRKLKPMFRALKSGRIIHLWDADTIENFFKEATKPSNPVMYIGKEFQELGNIPEKGSHV